MSRRASIRSLIDTDASTAPAGAAGLVAGIASRAPSGGRRPAPRSCDEALRWLMASDRLVSRQVARALQEVKDGRLYLEEGHARWSTYLRAFVPLTPRWSRQEMRLLRELGDYPALSADYEQGRIDKSHLRVILRVVTPQTESLWRARGRRLTVRQLEAAAKREKARATAADGPQAEAPVQRESRRRRRVVMAPQGVAVMVASAVEVARKLDGYQIGTGQAVAIMAMETMAALPGRPDASEDDGSPRRRNGSSPPAGGVGLPGDHEELRAEPGRHWAEAHRHMERITRRWSDLDWNMPEVPLDAAPPDDAGPHQRVVFWTRLQGRLDAVRGRLLRMVEERRYADRLWFAGLGQYARERMGPGLREARDLIRLDRALSDLPAAFRMYASGRLGKRAARLITKVARAGTDRAWTRFAMTHTLRLLEAAVEAALLRREADPAGWRRSGGLPPREASFAEVVRACSLLNSENDNTRPTARVRIIFDEEQQACLEADHVRPRSRAGPDTMANLVSLCAAHHRHLKHTVGSLELHGEAPHGLTVRMGGRIYRNDRLVRPVFNERELDDDPWRV